MCNAVPKKKRPDELGFYEPYASFSRTLRTWLVAYGIGAPVLFASQDAFKPILENSDQAMPIILIFFSGVIIQILAVLVYKYSMGYIYFGEMDEAFQRTIRFKISDWISEAMWLELISDLVSIGLFAWATLKVLELYVRINGSCLAQVK